MKDELVTQEVSPKLIRKGVTAEVKKVETQVPESRDQRPGIAAGRDRQGTGRAWPPEASLLVILEERWRPRVPRALAWGSGCCLMG